MAICEELPEEIWEQILNGLGEDHEPDLESLSLVNKRLLSLTDRLRSRFTVVDHTYFIHGTISRFLYRFKHLKTLDLSKLRHGNLETALREISRSSVALNLEILDISNHDSVPIECLKELGLSNRRIKVLRCANVTKLRDDDLIAIAEFHPDLEELDVSYPRHKFTIDAFRSCSIADLMITDAGIEVMSSGLKNLKKINISMNHLLTNKSIYSLSTNCLRLLEIKLIDCTLISMKGVRYMLQNSPNLRSISMCFISNFHGTSSLFKNPKTSSGLCNLHFKDSDISDEFLNSITKANIPLKQISLTNCKDYSIVGLSSFLNTYQSLEFLDLTRNNFINDTYFIHLSQYLHDLVSVNLNFCRSLTTKSLFTLIKNCPFLENLEMKHTDLGNKDYLIAKDVVNVNQPNPSIKFLNLANTNLNDECIMNITSICPKLQVLDVSSCSGITGSSLCEMLNHCPDIIQLRIQECIGVKNLGLTMEPLKLKNLFIAKSGVNDEGLVEIGVRCRELLKIDISGCLHVTTSAVKYLVKKCEKLREVNLMECVNLHVFIVDWMVFARPSLRKLVPPSYSVTTECQRKLLLRHGCHVCDR